MIWIENVGAVTLETALAWARALHSVPAGEPVLSQERP